MTGSELLVRSTLRQLLTWPAPTRRPDLAVVMVDCDDDGGRKARLESYLDGLSLPAIVAVPVQEIEAWLIADHAAVARVFQPAPNQPPLVEGMRRREAKELLNAWTSQLGSPSPREVRLTLARTCDLAALDRLTAFQNFVSDLRAKMQ